jgi:peptidoglycan-associated lipoprotein
MSGPINVPALLAAGATALALAGCPKRTADLELDAARQAIDDARARKASDCAPEAFGAAEAAIAEARALAGQGEVEAAGKRAGEAKALAERAAASSPPGCDQPAKAEDTPPAPRPDGAAVADASTAMTVDALLRTVHFDYNEATIREDSKADLDALARAMTSGSSLRLEVEGHCDVRGSTEYNLHLGERRAHAVRKYLETRGVRPGQVEIISYGEEKPLDLEGTEEAHARNRRAELRKL